MLLHEPESAAGLETGRDRPRFIGAARLRIVQAEALTSRRLHAGRLAESLRAHRRGALGRSAGDRLRRIVVGAGGQPGNDGFTRHSAVVAPDVGGSKAGAGAGLHALVQGLPGCTAVRLDLLSGGDRDRTADPPSRSPTEGSQSRARSRAKRAYGVFITEDTQRRRRPSLRVDRPLSAGTLRSSRRRRRWGKPPGTTGDSRRPALACGPA